MTTVVSAYRSLVLGRAIKRNKNKGWIPAWAGQLPRKAGTQKYLGYSHSARGTAATTMNRQDGKLAIDLKVADWMAAASGFVR